SSQVTSRIRARRSSGTRGRPFGKRSPSHAAVSARMTGSWFNIPESLREASVARSALEQADAVKLVRGGLVRHVDEVHGEARRESVFREPLREEAGVSARVRLAQAALLSQVALRVDQRVRRLRLAAERVHLDEVDLRERAAQARVPQPLLPAR